MTDSSRLADFILRRFAPRRAASIDDSVPLVQNGWLDSFAIVEVVAFLEREYGVRIAADEVTPENFETLTSIMRLVERSASR